VVSRDNLANGGRGAIGARDLASERILYHDDSVSIGASHPGIKADVIAILGDLTGIPIAVSLRARDIYSKRTEAL
tara:strand:- start:932 stop:1156 length:225 start_codon:yes stop_codon:yes gene_type:complete